MAFRFPDALYASVLLLALTAHASEPNQLTDAEKQAGWKLLFDGKTTKGWRGYTQTAMPAKGWRIEDGTLKKVGGERGGDIITVEKFNDFDLTWEWRISPGGNNGLKYLVTEDRPSAPGQEYQLIDDMKNADAKVGPHRATGSFYDVLPPSDDKPLRPAGEWNQSRILIQGNHVEHWLNGKKVVDADLASPEIKALIAASKFKAYPQFAQEREGYVALQFHGDEVAYRNVRIRTLDK
jgi:hypothetical protein